MWKWHLNVRFFKQLNLQNSHKTNNISRSIKRKEQKMKPQRTSSKTILLVCYHLRFYWLRMTTRNYSKEPLFSFVAHTQVTYNDARYPKWFQIRNIYIYSTYNKATFCLSTTHFVLYGIVNQHQTGTNKVIVNVKRLFHNFR